MRNTLAYSKKLEEAGLTREQAEAHLEILTEVVEDEMATKADLKEIHSSLKTDIKDVQTSLRTEIKAEIQEVRSQISELELRMTIKFGAMQVATIGILVTILKLT